MQASQDGVSLRTPRMDVRCEKCGTEYEFDETRVGANGITVKCTACGFVFKVRRPERRVSTSRPTSGLGSGPHGREWLVKQPAGSVIGFRELTTLQKWIVEGRIARDDEISKNGETWKRLGNILELEPFFAVYEKARQLNELIDRGQIDGDPIELRGSEVVGPASPVHDRAPHDDGRDTLAETNPARRALPISLAEARNAAGRSGLTADLSRDLSPTRGQVVAHAEISKSALPSPDVGTPRANAHSEGDAVADTLVRPPARTREPTPVLRAEIDTSLPRETGLLGPGALPSVHPRPAAASWTADLTYRSPQDTSASSIISEFKRAQRRRSVAMLLAFSGVLGGAGGIALAVYGPEGNPLRSFAERRGWIAREQREDARMLIEAARRAMDVDTDDSLAAASDALDRAQAIEPTNAALLADRSLVLTLRADALRRTATDLEERAARHAAQTPGHANTASTATTATTIDEETTQRAKALRERASALLVEGFHLAVSAFDRLPSAIEPARALAAYYQVQRDPVALARELARGRSILEKNGEIDATLLYIEAAAMFTSGMRSRDELRAVATLVEHAVTTHPTMHRARVLLARLHMAMGSLDDAIAQLDHVTSATPTHEEARRLTTYARELEATRRAELEAKAAEAAPPVETTGTIAPTATPVVEAPAVKSESRFDSWMASARRLRHADRTREAKDAYDRAADLQPTAAEPLVGLGWCYLDLENPMAALKAFQRAVAVNNRYAEAYYGIAEARRALGANAEAIEAYRRFVALAPKTSPDVRAARKQLDELERSALAGPGGAR